MATCTILEYLSRPNPKLSYELGGTSSSLTVNDRWLPIEGVRQWDDFTFDALYLKYKSSLSKPIPLYDPIQRIKRARLDDIVNEDTVTALVTVNNILPVSNALYETKKGLHYGPGSKIFRMQSDGSPDWGLGVDGAMNDQLYTLRNLCPGDLKTYSKWTADGLLDADWSKYLEDPVLTNKARPLEQAQHYGISLGTRYAWILTDAELVVIRITNSTDARRSPRQAREVSHNRVVSNTSSISQSMSAMSIDNSAYSGRSGSSSGINPASLEIARIPWSAGSSKSSKGKGREMTINLGLYFLAQLASDDCTISTSYPPIYAKSSKVPRAAQPPLPSTPEALEVAPSVYWIPSGEIFWDVIGADINIYIPGATVEQWENEGEPGYRITTATKRDKDELTMMFADLKRDGIEWEKEGGKYIDSKVHQIRSYYGGSYNSYRAS
ncbi:hypothetical protein LAWI1_G006186 [Lachnellula willkommii]|uniref:Uncharacterized protein n=1 Tax=Lachnellula willkommii TaxID=215461 RepID=A0A559MA57_9HELO|nr:hypothetical protein LAWI1_G006186 [Lachnellula willkommii]